MASHRSPSGGDAAKGRRQLGAHAHDVTEVIPFNEFGNLSELRFGSSSAFDTDLQVIHAPELDDLHDDVDDLMPLRLLMPVAEVPEHPRRQGRRTGGAPPHIADDRPRRHRETAATGAPTRRLLIAAMATGATAAAVAHATVFSGEAHANVHFLAVNEVSASMGRPAHAGGMQVVALSQPTNTATIHQEHARGVAFAQERAAREARLQRPLFVFPTQGIPTSGFGTRWGALHAGIDIANSIGTPILAVADGFVTDAGPTAGYGIGSNYDMPTAPSRSTVTSIPPRSLLGIGSWPAT